MPWLPSTPAERDIQRWRPDRDQWNSAYQNGEIYSDAFADRRGCEYLRSAIVYVTGVASGDMFVVGTETYRAGWAERRSWPYHGIEYADHQLL